MPSGVHVFLVRFLLREPLTKGHLSLREGKSVRTSIRFQEKTWVLAALTSGLLTMVCLFGVPAQADKHPDEASEMIAISQQIIATQAELSEVTRVTDVITHFALSYAYDPRGTIDSLYQKLQDEQKKVGVQMQRTRRHMGDFSHDGEAYAAIQESLGLLEARYSDIFNEIIETNSKGRLPVSLMGPSRAHAEALFARKAELTQTLANLHAKLQRYARPTVSQCASIFESN